MTASQQMLMAYSDTSSGGGSDPNFANVVFLSHFDGTNGGTTFTDVTGKTITATGVTTSTTNVKFGTAAAKFVRASSQFLSLATSADWTLGTGDWTIEMWIYLATSSGGTTQYVFDMRPASTHGTFVDMIIDSSGNINFAVDGTPHASSSSSQFSTGGSLNTWVHVAACKASGSTRLFLAGSQVGSTFTDSNNYASSARLFIGESSFGNSFFEGWMDDFRVTKGVARYTANFIPSTFAFPDS